MKIIYKEQCFTLMILQIFLNKNFLLVNSNFLHYCDVYEHGKLGISVTTSLIMALVIPIPEFDMHKKNF